MQFSLWACGHNHQANEDGRVTKCQPEVAWYMLEVESPREYKFYGRGRNKRGSAGLRRGDRTLHLQNRDGTYSPARTAPADAIAAANERGWTLKIWNPDQDRWVPAI